jgi:ribosomal protein S18 acetylase RimI-like enzyme
MRTIEVRALEPSEWRTFRDVRLAALAADGDAFLTSLEEAAAWPEDTWAAVADRRGVAFVDGEPVGMVGWSWHDDVDDPFLELISMWVRPDHRGGDVGPRLVELVERAASARGRPVRLAVFSDNERAVRFYAANSFVETRRDDFDDRRQLVWMELRRTSAD